MRTLLLDPATTGVAERTEALLMAADRAQHVAEVVDPPSSRGEWVVTDRFSASTLAYQGYGRGLDLGDLARLVEWATGGLPPDLNVLVDVSRPWAWRDGPGRAGTASSRRVRRSVNGWPTATGAWPPRTVPPGWWSTAAGTVDEVAELVWSGLRSSGRGPGSVVSGPTAGPRAVR